MTDDRPRDPYQTVADRIAAAEPVDAAPIDAAPVDDGPVEAGGGPPPPIEPPGGGEPADWGYDVEAMNAEWALVLMGSRAIVMHLNPLAPLEDRHAVRTVEAFGAWHANRFTQVRGSDGRRKTKTWAQRWLCDRARRQYRGIVFVPGDDAAAPEGYFNLWRGFAVRPRPSPPGACGYAVFRDHLATNVCGGDPALYAWVFAWFAHIVQRPRERIGTALVFRGRMGSGKTKVGEVFGALFPSHYFLVDDPRYVTGQFNAHMASCLLLQAEEAVWAGDKAAEGRLKGLVTSKFQMIEAKGVDPIRLDNHVRLIMTSNENWVVPAGKDERRFCVLDVADHVAGQSGYFGEMDREMDGGGREALLADLLACDLDAVDLRKIPKTGALLEQKIRSFDSIESWWFERLQAGQTTRKTARWLGEIERELLFEDYLSEADRIGIKRRAAATEVGMTLKRLVPGLGDIRPRRIGADGEQHRVRVYVMPDLAACRAAYEVALQQRIEWCDPEGEAGEWRGGSEQDFEG